MAVTVSERSRQYVRKRAQNHMQATITMYRTGDVEFDDETGIADQPARTAYYTGKARIWQVNAGSTIMVGEADIALANTNISIPWGAADPHKDDIIIVDTNPSDATVVGKAFCVSNIDGGGLIGGTIRMTCSSFTDSAVWSE